MFKVKNGGKALLAIFGFLLFVSVVFALAAFRLERTTRSYTYMSKQLEQILAPLSNPEIRAAVADGTFSYLRNELTLEISPRLEPYLQEAVLAGFDDDWFLRTGKRMLFNTQHFLSGQESEFSLPVSIDGFKLLLMDSVRQEFETREYLEIDRVVSRMSSSLDLVTVIPENDLSLIMSRSQTYRSLLMILAYVVPGVLIVLCFCTRRIWRGLAAAGGGLLAGGGLVMVVSLSMQASISRVVSSAIGGVLPPFLGWIKDGAGKLAADLVSGLLPPASVVAGLGLVLVVLGVFLTIRKEGSVIKTSDTD
jgi:hypothetical protein